MSLHVAVSAWTWSPSPSGANRRLLGILRALPEHLEPGERVTILHRPGARPDDLPARLECRAIPLPAGPAPWRALRESRLLPRALRALGANLLDIGTLPLTSGLPCPACLTIHDLRDVDGFPRRPVWLSHRVLLTAVSRAAAVVVPSRFTAARLRAVTGPRLRAVTVVPGAVDDPATTPPAAGDFFLHVGHLEARKNLAVLVQALRSVPDGELRLAGADHGVKRGLTRLARRLGLAHRVRFLGVVTEAELARQYTGARAVLVPSRYEGFGLPALEGLVRGLPVLVSDRGALPEVVGRAAVVLPAEDPAAWARAMTAVVHAEHLGAVADRIRHARTFSWQRAAASTLECWRSTAAAQPRATTIAR